MLLRTLKKRERKENLTWKAPLITDQKLNSYSNLTDKKKKMKNMLGKM